MGIFTIVLSIVFMSKNNEHYLYDIEKERCIIFSKEIIEVKTILQKY